MIKQSLFVLAFVCVLSASAQLRLPALVSSGMVLQQNDSVNLWGWAGPDDWVYVSTSWNNKKDSTRASNGAKWRLKIKTPKAGGPYVISIKSQGKTTTLNDVLIGEVWVGSGQSNMDWSYYHGLKDVKAELPTCYNKNIRFFYIQKTTADYPQDDVRGSWEVCDSNTLKRFSAVAYFFGKRINQQLNVPVGLIHASWGGTPAETWVPDSYIAQNQSLQAAANKLQTFKWWPSATGKAYNAMIAPLTNFTIAGALWYQGESNTGTNSTYHELMVTLINAWRAAWKQDFYFNVVQIAPFAYGNHNIGALVQEAQWKLLSHPKTGVIVITDLVDDIKDIHPTNKHDVGLRLANWALGETYGVSGLAYKSPSFQSVKIEKGKVMLTIQNAPNGLVAKGNSIQGFYVSGEKEQWFPAEAKIVGNTITVWSKQVPVPAQVRFGFGNTIIGNVFSKEGLPLAPFRTDTWPVDQSAVKP